MAQPVRKKIRNKPNPKIGHFPSGERSLRPLTMRKAGVA